MSNPPDSLFPLVRFTLTAEHVALIRRMNVGWQPYGGESDGAPEIDPKRPYGNSAVIDDVLEILGVRPEGDEYGEEAPSEAQEKQYGALHRETEKALQVVLASGSFEPGEYVANQYHNNWRRA